MKLGVFYLSDVLPGKHLQVDHGYLGVLGVKLVELFQRIKRNLLGASMIKGELVGLPLLLQLSFHAPDFEVNGLRFLHS